MTLCRTTPVLLTILAFALAGAPAAEAQDRGRRPPAQDPAAAQRGHPQWAPSIEAGLADAKKRGVALMVAINMDNERGNQGMVDNVYTSEEFHKAAASCAITIGSLFKHGVRPDPKTGKSACSRFGSVKCDEHQAVESFVRQDWLKRGPKDDVESPRHFFLAPNGQILFQKVWTMTAKDLSALMTRASELCTPERLAAWDTLEGRLERAQDPIAAVRDIALAELISANDPVIDERLGAIAKKTKDALVAGSIYGAFVAAEGHDRRKAAEGALSHKAPEVRMTVAYAMQKSGNVEYLKPILARATKEKDAKAKAAVYRAIGVLGPEDDKVRKVLQKAVGNSKDPARGHAAIAVAPWAEDKKVQAALRKMLPQGGSQSVRAAAVWALGLSKNPDVRDELIAYKETLGRWDWILRRTTDAAIKQLRRADDEGYAQAGSRILKHPVDGDSEEDEREARANWGR